MSNRKIKQKTKKPTLKNKICASYNEMITNKTKRYKFCVLFNIIVFLCLYPIGVSIIVKLLSLLVLNWILSLILIRNFKTKISVSTFFLGLMFTGILSNQLVQPLFEPRLNSFKVTPEYIQFRENDGYFTVFKVSYLIDAPLIPLNKNITLSIPGYHEDYVPLKPCNDIFIESSYFPFNPYIEITDDLLSARKNIDELKGKLTIKLATEPFMSKNVEFDLYLSEKTDLREQGLGLSNYYWWNDQCIDPTETYAITSPYDRLLGYGYVTYTSGGNTTYALYERTIKNLNNLEVRGYLVNTDTDSFETICFDGIQLNTRTCKDDPTKECISIDIEPKQTLKFLVMKPLKMQTYDPYLQNEKPFELDGIGSVCSFGWRKYLELTGSTNS